MTWEDSRASGTVTAVRRSAHSDDAKHRVDDATRLVPRARWLVPAVVAGVLVLLLGGGAAAVLATRGSDSPSPSSQGSADQSPGGETSKGEADGEEQDPGSVPSSDAENVDDTSFTATGSARTAVQGVNGGKTTTQNGAASVTITCSATACTITDATGSVSSSSDNGSPRQAPTPGTWTAGRHPGARAVSSDADFDLGMPWIDLVIDGDDVRLVARSKGVSFSRGTCFRNIPNATIVVHRQEVTAHRQGTWSPSTVPSADARPSRASRPTPRARPTGR